MPPAWLFLDKWCLKGPFFSQDTMEFIRSFQSEAPLRRGVVSAQDASLQERVLAQVSIGFMPNSDLLVKMWTLSLK